LVIPGKMKYNAWNDEEGPKDLSNPDTFLAE
jgi:hypothetical protein